MFPARGQRNSSVLGWPTVDVPELEDIERRTTKVNRRQSNATEASDSPFSSTHPTREGASASRMRTNTLMCCSTATATSRSRVPATRRNWSNGAQARSRQRFSCRGTAFTRRCGVSTRGFRAARNRPSSMSRAAATSTRSFALRRVRNGSTTRTSRCSRTGSG